MALIIGGYSNSGDERRTWILTKQNDNTFEILPGPEMAESHTFHGCAFDSKKQEVIVVGGVEGTSTVEILDVGSGPIQNNAWRPGPELPEDLRLYQHQLIYNPKLDNVLLITGSNNGEEIVSVFSSYRKMLGQNCQQCL